MQTPDKTIQFAKEYLENPTSKTMQEIENNKNFAYSRLDYTEASFIARSAARCILSAALYKQKADSYNCKEEAFIANGLLESRLSSARSWITKFEALQKKGI